VAGGATCETQIVAVAVESRPRALPRDGYRRDIDGLRAIAVTLVVAYHSIIPGFTGGFVGVDVFFVISGFLITGLIADELLRTGTLSLTTFYVRRARRLLPMAMLVLLTTAIAFAFILSPIDFSALAGDIRAATLYYANWHFASSSLVYGSATSVNPVLHYWSLSVEEQFYILWPPLLFLVSRTRKRSTSRRRYTPYQRMAATLTAVVVVSLGLSVWVTDRSSPYGYYGLHTRAWELAAGGLLALYLRSPRRVTKVGGQVGGALGLAAIAVATVAFGPTTRFPGIAATLPVAGALLLLWAGAGTHLSAVNRALSSRPFSYVGRISYCWYLWHWPCLILAGTLAARPSSLKDWNTYSLPHGWTAAAAVAASFALSVVSHHFIEDPVRRFSWATTHRRVFLASAAGAMVATVAVINLVLPVSNGATNAPVRAYVASGAITNTTHGQGLAGTSDVRAQQVRLTMTPVAARQNLPGGTRDCYSSYQATVAPADCLFGDTAATTTVALIGDSHAQQWFPAFDQAAKAHHWRLWLWTKPACPIIDLSVRLPQFDGTYPWCSQWRESVLARLAALPEVDAVVVTNYAGVIDVPGRFATPQGRSLSPGDIASAWRTAWGVTEGQLASVARRVVVLRDTPRPARDVPACLAASGVNDLGCSFSHSQALTDSNELYRAEQASLPASQFLDLAPEVCPGTPCPVVTSRGDIIYRDAQHMTATFSAELAPVIGRDMVPQLVPRS
jgi:peptidoglycan/LPS O-acetylase OafA/YrhL